MKAFGVLPVLRQLDLTIEKGEFVALLDAAGVEDAALVGHSMGSLIALEAASRFPERVSSIVLVGTAVPMPVSEALLTAARDARPKADGMVNVWSHGARGAIGGNTVPGMWMMGASLRLMERAAPGVLHNDLNACNAYARGPEAAAAAQCPALLVVGSRDMMTSPRRTDDGHAADRRRAQAGGGDEGCPHRPHRRQRPCPHGGIPRCGARCAARLPDCRMSSSRSRLRRVSGPTRP